MSWLRKLFGKKDELDEEASERYGSIGVLLQWDSIGELTLTSQLFVGDGQMAPHHPGIIVDLDAGVYDVSARKIDFTGDIRVASLRVLAQGSQGERGQKIGESWADTGTQGVCDYDAYRKAIEGMDGEAYFSQHEDELCADDYGTVTLAPNAVLILCSSGFGDGFFPVFNLLDPSGKQVGVEVQMIAEDQPFPY